MSTVQEIESAIRKLAPAERDQLVRDLPSILPELELDTTRPHGDAVNLDLEKDSPELEAELLKAVKWPHAPFSETELRGIADRALQDHRARRAK